MNEITLTVDNIEYANFTTARVTLALDTLANDFELTATVKGTERPGFAANQICFISVNGKR